MCLVVTVGAAVLRPWRVQPAVVAVPAAALLLLTRTLDVRAAAQVSASLGPTIGFLAAVLVIGHLCERMGVFAACGVVMSRASRGRPRTLFVLAFALAALVTVVLSLDATIVLLTPVIYAAARREHVAPRPAAFAGLHLANSASLLLPVSNLTNLIAFRGMHTGFVVFAGRMALPWLATLAVEYVVLRVYFSRSLPRAPARGATAFAPPSRSVVAALAIIALTLTGFAVAPLLHVDEAVVAAAGACCLAVPAFALRRASARSVARSMNLPLLLFVLALGMVVQAASAAGLGHGIDALLPRGDSFLALLVIAAIAAALANAVNNLPATLLLLPALLTRGQTAVLAGLIGLDAGPNLTYLGSLAGLLWRDVARAHDERPPLRDIAVAGAITVPIALTVATASLWLVAHVL